MSTSPIEFPDRTSVSGQVAANVRAEAARVGIKQRKFAVMIGMSQAAVSDRYTGKTPWTLDELGKVADALGVPFEVLCARRDSNPQPSDWEFSAIVTDLTAYRAGRAA